MKRLLAWIPCLEGNEACYLSDTFSFTFLFVTHACAFSRYKAGIPQDLVPVIVEQMKPYISINDISYLSHALSILALLLDLSPQLTYPAVESEFLKDVCLIAHSPLITGSSLDSLLLFFASLVQADSQIATHVIPNLTLPLANEKKSDTSYGNVAKCIGTIVRCHPSLAAGTIAEFSKALKVSWQFSFLTIKKCWSDVDG